MMIDSTNEATDGAGLLVLVAEDDDELRRLFCEWLSSGGYRVDCVGSGIELAEYMADALLDGRPERGPDLIVSDVRMPGFDGLRVLRALRSVEPAVRCLVVTGFGDRSVHEEAMRLGARGVLDKPVEREDLLAAVAAALERCGSTDAARAR